MAFLPANIGGNGGTAESLTPSNSTPAQITSGNDYHATAGGYAIESYDSITPSSTPESVSSGDIVKIGGSGVIVDAMPPTPASITPSNATPVALTADTPVNPTTAGYAIESYNTKTPSNATPAHLVSGEINKMGGTGYAIESYTTLTNMPTTVSTGDMLRANGAGSVSMLQTITPSNTNPPRVDYSGGYTSPAIPGYVIQSYTAVTPSSTPTSVSAGNMVQIGGSGVIVDSIPTPAYLLPSNSNPAAITNGGLYQATDNGYAISSYSSKTPSDTSPASVSSGAIIKASSSGYLYKTVQPKVVTGSYTMTTSEQTITCGFQPKYIMFTEYKNSNVFAVQIYDERRSTANAIRGIKNSSSSSGVADLAIGSGNVRLTAITSTGFTIGAGDNNHTGTIYYVAVG